MSLTIIEQPVVDLLEELWPLLAEHREELTTNKALMQLDPDVDRYRAMEVAGVLMGLIARDGVRIVGYSINVVAPNLHYRGVVMCTNDVLFVSKHARASLGLRLIDSTRRAAAARGTRLMCWHAKPGTPLEKILRARQCRVQDIVFTEEL